MPTANPNLQSDPKGIPRITHNPQTSHTKAMCARMSLSTRMTTGKPCVITIDTTAFNGAPESASWELKIPKLVQTLWWRYPLRTPSPRLENTFIPPSHADQSSGDHTRGPKVFPSQHLYNERKDKCFSTTPHNHTDYLFYTLTPHHSYHMPLSQRTAEAGCGAHKKIICSCNHVVLTLFHLLSLWFYVCCPRYELNQRYDEPAHFK